MEYIIDWLNSIEQTYGVNPYIFAAIYIGATPLFWFFTYKFVKNLKNKKPITVSLLGLSGCAVSSYVYLLIAGKNIPFWVYLVIIAMAVYGLYSVRAHVQKKKRQVEHEL